MGSVYRQKGRTIWWIKYRGLDGQVHRESSKSTKKEVAKRLLRDRDHATDQGVLVTPEVGKLTFTEAVDILVNYHEVHDRQTTKLKGRIAKHLTPFFGPRRPMATITGALVEAYKAHRKQQTVHGHPVQNATINRELAWLKQMFTLAIKQGKLVTRPTIELFEERNARQGFLTPEQVTEVLKHLPEDLRPVVQFAFITGWRVKSEVLTREWRHVDLQAGTIRLDPGESKNKEPRTFHFTTELRALLETQSRERERLKKKGQMTGFGSDPVFFRMVALGRRGPLRPRRIKSITKAFKAACKAAGYPGRIPHDLRRSAIRTFVRKGISTHVAMKLSGHKTESVFRRYDIISDEDLKDAAALLDGKTTAQVG